MAKGKEAGEEGAVWKKHHSGEVGGLLGPNQPMAHLTAAWNHGHSGSWMLLTSIRHNNWIFLRSWASLAAKSGCQV
jgi:hypothetical protein